MINFVPGLHTKILVLSQVVKCDDSDADELAAASSRLDPMRNFNVTLLDHGHC